VRKVVGDERLRAAILFDERYMRRAATERLDPDRAGAREAVEDARALDPRREDVEQRLAQLVGRRPQPIPCRGLEATALQRSCYHSHPVNFFHWRRGPTPAAN